MMEVLVIRKDLLQQYLDESLVQHIVTLTKATLHKLDFFYQFKCEHCSYGTDKTTLLKMHNLTHLRKKESKNQVSFADNQGNVPPETESNTSTSEFEANTDIPKTDANVGTRNSEANNYGEEIVAYSNATETDLSADAPETELSADAPETELSADAPETELSADAPETELSADAPETELSADAPETELSADAPETDLSADALETDLNADAPETDLNADAPKTDLNANAPESDLNANAPETNLNGDAPEIDTNDYAPKTDLNDYAYEIDLKAYAPETNLNANGPKTDLNGDVADAKDKAETSDTGNNADTPVNDFNSAVLLTEFIPDIPENADNTYALDIEVNENMKYIQCVLCCKSIYMSDKQDIESTQGYKCPDCCGDFEKMISMLEETSISHDTENTPSTEEIVPEVHRCDICLKCFSSATSVKKHKRVHFKTSKVLNLSADETLSDNAHPCDMCHKSYKHPGSLKRHMEVHQNESVTEFDSTLSLEDINEINSKFTPRKDYRSKQNASPSFVNIHGCEYCSKSYASKGSLMRHMKAVHTLSQSMIVI